MKTNYRCERCENTGFITIDATDMDDFRFTPLNFDEGSPFHTYPCQIRCPNCTSESMLMGE